METKKVQESVKQNWFIEKLNKIQPNKQKKEGKEDNVKLRKLEVKKEDVITNTMRFKGSLGTTLKFYILINENLEEMARFLNAFDLPKFNQETINHLNRCMKKEKEEENKE
jgi:hypothetical protein